jgi:hypothetical protein
LSIFIGDESKVSCHKISRREFTLKPMGDEKLSEMRGRSSESLQGAADVYRIPVLSILPQQKNPPPQAGKSPTRFVPRDLLWKM